MMEDLQSSPTIIFKSKTNRCSIIVNCIRSWAFFLGTAGNWFAYDWIKDSAWTFQLGWQSNSIEQIVEWMKVLEQNFRLCYVLQVQKLFTFFVATGLNLWCLMAIVSATEGNSNQKIVSEQKVTEFKKKKKVTSEWVFTREMFSISDICKHAELIHFAGAEVKYLQKVISKHDGNTELEKMLREIEVLRRIAFRVCHWIDVTYIM